MKTKQHKFTFATLPTEYTALCNLVLPRPIHENSDYEDALEIIEAMVGFGDDFSPDQADYFAALTDFVAAYEDSEPPQRGPHSQPPLESLKYLLEENDMTAADLSRLLGSDRTLGAKILRGERNLTVPHLRILAERFKVSPALFI